MADPQAKLRSDLEIRSEPDSRIILKDPVTRRFYRFSPVQGSVLELLDGRNDAADIARMASERHQAEVTPEQAVDPKTFETLNPGETQTFEVTVWLLPQFNSESEGLIVPYSGTLSVKFIYGQVN
jgi:hypothetical protein